MIAVSIYRSGELRRWNDDEFDDRPYWPRYPALISKVKNQGTNDAREREGLPRQARGNAIERLGKNLIGLRTALLRESIFQFVCFGYGCDFENGSSILDRVSTMAMFGQLNRTYLLITKRAASSTGAAFISGRNRGPSPRCIR